VKNIHRRRQTYAPHNTPHISLHEKEEEKGEMTQTKESQIPKTTPKF
jgi:hypothetical protein